MIRWLVLGMLACGPGKSGDTSADGAATGGGTGGGATPTTPFVPAVSAIRLEVDYQSGAAPYTGSSGLGGGDLWDLFDANAAALFPDTPVTAPRTLDAMEELTEVAGDAFDVDAILAIADAHRDDLGDDSTLTYYAVWLDGRYVDASGETQDGVLGVSIGRTRVIAMFKPVIASVGVLPTTREFGEQAVLVHEFGHAVGLVDNGVDMVDDHRDAEHGAHCNVDDCIMYWSLESRSALADFVLDRISGGDEVLFDDLCLQDVAAAR